MPALKPVFALLTIAMPSVVFAQDAADAPVIPMPVWAYQTPANYCPTGTQPVTNGDGVGCGKANQSVSYQVATGTHGGGSRTVCPVGEKGCYAR